jgi:hypothetical protein
LVTIDKGINKIFFLNTDSLEMKSTGKTGGMTKCLQQHQYPLFHFDSIFKPSIRATCAFFPSKDMTTSLIVKGYSTKQLCFFLLRVMQLYR